MSEILARAVGLTKHYGPTVALDGVDLEVAAGELVGLLGPNGAGKSTLLNLLVGLRHPTSGRAELFGRAPTDAAARRHLGTTPQETGLPSTLRVTEVIEFVGRHFPDPLGVGELLERFALEGTERRQTGGLSGGQKRRLAVALAFVGRPRLVVLDEPTTGLDVEARRALWAGIREFHAGGGTVLLTSHYLEEIEALAQRVVVVGSGRVLADGSVDEIRTVVGLNTVTLRSADLPELTGVAHTQRTGDRVELLTPDSDELVRSLVRSGTPFTDLRVAPTSLEEAFLALTSAAVTRKAQEDPHDVDGAHPRSLPVPRDGAGADRAVLGAAVPFAVDGVLRQRLRGRR